MIDERYRCIGIVIRLKIIMKYAVDKIEPIYFVIEMLGIKQSYNSKKLIITRRRIYN